MVAEIERERMPRKLSRRDFVEWGKTGGRPETIDRQRFLDIVAEKNTGHGKLKPALFYAASVLKIPLGEGDEWRQYQNLFGMYQRAKTALGRNT